MFTINEDEIREWRQNIMLITAGIVLVGIILLISRGDTWFTATAWSKVSIVQWGITAAICIVALLLQYIYLRLLRHSIWKYSLWILLAIWAYNNGMVGIQRLFDQDAGLTLTGWIPVTDLLGWLMAAVFWPLFIAGGSVTAIIDSGSFLFTQPCHYARLALDAAGIASGDIVGYVLNHLSVFWDLVSDSFVRQVMDVYSHNRSFLDFSVSGAFGLPHWFYSLGYSCSCLAV